MLRVGSIFLHIGPYRSIYVHIGTYRYIYRYIQVHIPTYTYIYVHIPTYIYIYLHIPTYRREGGGGEGGGGLAPNTLAAVPPYTFTMVHFEGLWSILRVCANFEGLF